MWENHEHVCLRVWITVLFIVRKGYKVRVFLIEEINEPEKGFSERTVTLKEDEVQNLKMEGISVFVLLIGKDEGNANLIRVHKIFYIRNRIALMDKP